MRSRSIFKAILLKQVQGVGERAVDQARSTFLQRRQGCAPNRELERMQLGVRPESIDGLAVRLRKSGNGDQRGPQPACRMDCLQIQVGPTQIAHRLENYRRLAPAESLPEM